MRISPLWNLTFNAPAHDQRDGLAVSYAIEGGTVFRRQVDSRSRAVYVGEAARDLSVPLRGLGYTPAILSQYRDTALTRAFAADVWRERFE